MGSECIILFILRICASSNIASHDLFNFLIIILLTQKLTLQGRLDERRLQINPLIPPPSYRDARSRTHPTAITLGSDHATGYDQQDGSESFVYVEHPVRPSKDGAQPFFDDDVLGERDSCFGGCGDLYGF